MRHLLLDLDAPLMSFGGDMVDAYGVVRDFPAKSMVAGLLANALGWERYDVARHARLQERLTVGSVRVVDGRRIRDFQTAQLGGGDRGWTTRGRVEGRAGGAATYLSPHIRYRDADANARVLVALRLNTPDEAPGLDGVRDALDCPERPLFIGRKPFLPSRRLVLGEVDAPSIRAALELAVADLDARAELPADAADFSAQWPAFEARDAADGVQSAEAVEEELTDERHWPACVHAGLRRVMVGRIACPVPARPDIAA